MTRDTSVKRSYFRSNLIDLTLFFQDRKYLLCQPIACIQGMIRYKGIKVTVFLKDFERHSKNYFYSQ